MLKERLAAPIIRQFAKPSGFVGRLVGFILANRGSNVRRSKWTVELLGLAPGDRVLEVGCGPGVAIKECLRRIKKGQAVGIDHSDVMIAQARNRNRRAVRKGRLKLTVGTPDDLSKDERPFDKVFSINVIQFVPDKEAFIEACAARITTKGALATTFQPRGTRPTREAALAMAETLAQLAVKIGLTDVRTEILQLRPVPAICLARRT